MERVERHLRRRLADGLRRQRAHGLARRHHRLEVLDPHHDEEGQLGELALLRGAVVSEHAARVAIGEAGEEVLHLLAHGADVVAEVEARHDRIAHHGAHGGRRDLLHHAAAAELDVEHRGVALLLHLADRAREPHLAATRRRRDVASLPPAIHRLARQHLDHGALLIRDGVLVHLLLHVHVAGGAGALAGQRGRLDLAMHARSADDVDLRVGEELRVQREPVRERRAVAGHERQAVVRALHELRVDRVDGVVAVHKLHDAAVGVAHRVVVVDLQVLQVLHQATLQVAGARGLHGRVDQTLAPRHAMEIVVLRPQPREEAVGDVAARARRRVERHKRRQGLAGRHARHAPALEFLLAEAARNHRVVDQRALGAGEDNERQRVLREQLHLPARQALLDHIRVDGRQRALDGVVELRASQVRRVLIERLAARHALTDHGAHRVARRERNARSPLADLGSGRRRVNSLRLAGRGLAGGVLHGGGRAAPLSGHLDAFAVHRFHQSCPRALGLGRQQQVVNGARRRRLLQEHREQARERRQQRARRVRAVELVHGVHEAKGRGADLRLVEHAREELVVADAHEVVARVAGLGARRAPQVGLDLALAVHVEVARRLGQVAREREQQRRDDLLARPERRRLQYCRRQRLKLGARVLLEARQALHRHVGQLLVLVAREEHVAHREHHGHTHVVLNQAAQRLAVGGHQVLELRRRDLVRLRAAQLVLREVHVHLVAVKVGVVRLAVGVVHADGLLRALHGSSQHSCPMRHDRRLVQRRLPVHQHDVTVAQVPPHALHPKPRPADAAARAVVAIALVVAVAFTTVVDVPGVVLAAAAIHTHAASEQVRDGARRRGIVPRNLVHPLHARLGGLSPPAQQRRERLVVVHLPVAIALAPPLATVAADPLAAAGRALRRRRPCSRVGERALACLKPLAATQRRALGRTGEVPRVTRARARLEEPDIGVTHVTARRRDGLRRRRRSRAAVAITTVATAAAVSATLVRRSCRSTTTTTNTTTATTRTATAAQRRLYPCKLPCERAPAVALALPQQPRREPLQLRGLC
mmetsp:Transcript_24752/g.86164  ORF Transcript_24752/g.86164 Transcript_24752/m.86164 type:complete len:1050 (-) Transcript_24752:600-3749(-)